MKVAAHFCVCKGKIYYFRAKSECWWLNSCQPAKWTHTFSQFLSFKIRNCKRSGKFSCRQISKVNTHIQSDEKKNKAEKSRRKNPRLWWLYFMASSGIHSCSVYKSPVRKTVHPLHRRCDGAGYSSTTWPPLTSTPLDSTRLQSTKPAAACGPLIVRHIA